jgi:hypothetical protein
LTASIIAINIWYGSGSFLKAIGSTCRLTEIESFLFPGQIRWTWTRLNHIDKQRWQKSTVHNDVVYEIRFITYLALQKPL